MSGDLPVEVCFVSLIEWRRETNRGRAAMVGSSGGKRQRGSQRREGQGRVEGSTGFGNHFNSENKEEIHLKI